MSRKWRTHEGAAKLRAVSRAKSEAALELWALAVGFKAGILDEEHFVDRNERHSEHLRGGI